MNANSQIGTLIDLTERLTEVMAREVEHLRAMRSSEIATLQDEKARLAAAYIGAFETLRENPAAMTDAEPRLRGVLKKATAVLQATVEDNVRAITAAKALNERLIKALSAAVAETLMPVAAYTSTGGTAPTASVAGPVSLAVDNRI